MEKIFDYQIFFSKMTYNAVCQLMIRYSGNHCNVQSLTYKIYMHMNIILYNYDAFYDSWNVNDKTSFFSRMTYIREIFFFCHWFAMSNSCYNPFIYALQSVSLFMYKQYIYSLFERIKTFFLHLCNIYLFALQFIKVFLIHWTRLCSVLEYT